jgi:hypothetical protein
MVFVAWAEEQPDSSWCAASHGSLLVLRGVMAVNNGDSIINRMKINHPSIVITRSKLM